MPFLTVSNVSKTIDRDFSLWNITFSQRQHQNVAIAGETGSGKSTLLKIIAGLVQTDKGEVSFEGERVKGPDEMLVPGHPSIAYLSQNFELAKFLRVEQVLSYSNTISEADAKTLFDVCQISHLLKRKTDQLSGGERQRIAICRLLISSPKLLLLDEPYSHLDLAHKNTLKHVIRDIGHRLKLSCILVSHHPQDTLAWADKIIVMRHGRVVQEGTPARIYNTPVDEYTAGLFGKYALVNGAVSKVFAEKFGLPARRSMMIRPEHLRLVSRSSNGVKGEVVEVNFLGNQSEVDVLLGAGQVVTVRDAKGTAAKGDTVFVAFTREHLARN